MCGHEMADIRTEVILKGDFDEKKVFNGSNEIEIEKCISHQLSILCDDTKHINTQVLVENGGTVVSGGIFQQTERNNFTKVPLFCDIPGLGNLFRSNAKTDDKTELMVFLTPKVISDRVNVRQLDYLAHAVVFNKILQVHFSRV